MITRNKLYPRCILLVNLILLRSHVHVFFFLQIRKYVVEYLLILIISIVTCYIFIWDFFISWFCSNATWHAVNAITYQVCDRKYRIRCCNCFIHFLVVYAVMLVFVLFASVYLIFSVPMESFFCILYDVF